MLVLKFWNTYPFRGCWTRKIPLFNRNRWFWGPIKYPLLIKTQFVCNIRQSTLFRESENNCIKRKAFFYVHRIFIPSNACWVVRFKYIYANETRMKPERSCKIITLIQNFTDLCLKVTHFSWFHQSAPPIEKISFFPRKWVRAWVYDLVGRGGAGYGWLFVSWHIERDMIELCHDIISTNRSTDDMSRFNWFMSRSNWIMSRYDWIMSRYNFN